MSAADGKALRQAILDDFDDDAPRLVYADWLMERGDPYGEFIRLQCEDARGRLTAEQRHRMRALLLANEKIWLGEVARATDLHSRRWERGFLAGCALSRYAEKLEGAVGAWAWPFVQAIESDPFFIGENGQELAKRILLQPLRHLRTVTNTSRELACDLLVSDGLPALETLGMHTIRGAFAPGTRGRAELLEALEHGPLRPRLTCLRLDNEHPGVDLAAEIVATRAGKNLRRLVVDFELSEVGAWQRELPRAVSDCALCELVVESSGYRVTLAKDEDGGWSRLEVRGGARKRRFDPIASLLGSLPDGALRVLSIEHLPKSPGARERVRDLTRGQRNLERLEMPDAG